MDLSAKYDDKTYAFLTFTYLITLFVNKGNITIYNFNRRETVCGMHCLE